MAMLVKLHQNGNPILINLNLFSCTTKSGYSAGSVLSEAGVVPATIEVDESLDEILAIASGEIAAPMPWPLKGVRVEGESVVICANDNHAARFICGEILDTHTINKSKLER